MNTTVRRRVARKPRPCPGCDRIIAPGATYLEHTEFPGGEAGWADAAGHPVRMSECADCATRYGRGELLGTRAKGGAR